MLNQIRKYEEWFDSGTLDFGPVARGEMTMAEFLGSTDQKHRREREIMKLFSQDTLANIKRLGANPSNADLAFITALTQPSGYDTATVRKAMDRIRENALNAYRINQEDAEARLAANPQEAQNPVYNRILERQRTAREELQRWNEEAAARREEWYRNYDANRNQRTQTQTQTDRTPPLRSGQTPPAPTTPTRRRWNPQTGTFE